MQLSSLDAERWIALGRVIDVPLRRSQSRVDLQERAVAVQGEVGDSTVKNTCSQAEPMEAFQD